MVASPRGKVEAVAIVTSRFKPFNIAGQTVAPVGVPWHFGWLHPKDGGRERQSAHSTIGGSQYEILNRRPSWSM